MIGLDCTHLRCPEFTVPVMRLIKANAEPEKEVIIKTHEKRARNRVEHLCVSFGWQFIAAVEEGDIIYIKLKC
jgi:TusA-related sulfurtransferase